MLSMKSSTSRPSSRKRSAIVRPVSATRRRLPGGSFICPNTIATLSSHLRVHHLVIEVVAFARALADAGEHRQARVLLRDVVDQLHHGDGLADAGAAEEADLAALGERADEVDDLDAGLEQLDRRRELVERRRERWIARRSSASIGPALVDRAAEHVHDAAERRPPTGTVIGAAGVHDLHPAAQAVGGAERDRAHDAVAELLLDLEREAHLRESAVTDRLEHERVVDLRHLARAGTRRRRPRRCTGRWFPVPATLPAIVLVPCQFLRCESQQPLTWGSGRVMPVSSTPCLDRRRAADDLGQLLGDRRLPGLVVDELQLVDDRRRRCRRPPSSPPSAPTARRPCSR